MKFHRLAIILVITAMTALLVGCAGLGLKPAISVAFTPSLTPPASMDPSTTASVAATVSNDSANAGVNWTVSCESNPCGFFSTPNPIASGSSVTYNAPDTVPTDNTVTLTATSVTDNTKSVSAVVTITGNGK